MHITMDIVHPYSCGQTWGEAKRFAPPIVHSTPCATPNWALPLKSIPTWFAIHQSLLDSLNFHKMSTSFIDYLLLASAQIIVTVCLQLFWSPVYPPPAFCLLIFFYPQSSQFIWKLARNSRLEAWRWRAFNRQAGKIEEHSTYYVLSPLGAYVVRYWHVGMQTIHNQCSW